MKSSTVDPALLNEARLLEKKWSHLRALEGVSDPHTRLTLATLLENQNLANRKFLGESAVGTSATATDDVAVFRRVSLPMVKRIYAPLIANKIVSVQPMLGPVGLVHYLRFRYATKKGSQQSSNVAWPTANWDDNSMQQLSGGTPVANTYYSSGRVDQETQTNAGGGTTVTYTLQHTPIVADGIVASSADASLFNDAVTAGNSYTFMGKLYDGGVAIYDLAGTGSGTVTLTRTAIGSPSPTVTAATVDITTGTLTLTYSSDPGANSLLCSYNYNMECNTDLPEVNMTVEQDTITAETNKLKAVWSWEAQQDLRSQHNVDAEQALTAVMAQEISLEIDRQIINDLRNGAGTVTTWNYNTALGDTIKERYESLYVKLVQTSNMIMKKTLRGAANWVVASPEICSIFETATAGFAPAPADGFESALGIQYVGTVNNRWKLYKDPLFRTDEVLLGFRGDSVMDSGYFFCPYIPLQITPVVLDPESLCPRKGVITRNGKKLLRDGGRYYARLSVLNFSVS